MGMPDVVTKMYIRENAVFADVVNYFIYGGRQVVVPEDLTEVDPTELILLPGTKEKRQRKRGVEKYRDALKYAVIKNDKEAAYVVFGIENQTKIHYAMPVRNMLYDAMQYSRQVDKAAKRHKQEQEKQGSGEFLSGFKKEDRLLPVITFVVLFNDEKWDGPRTIHEMLATKNSELLKYVQDYRIHLIEPASMTKDDFKRFQTNLREVLEYIKCSNEPRQLRALIEENPRMQHIDVKAVEVINAVTSKPVKIEEGEETVNMGSAIEEMIKEGEKNGRIEGGIDMLVKLVRASLLNEEIAAEQAGMSTEQFCKEMERRCEGEGISAVK